MFQETNYELQRLRIQEEMVKTRAKILTYDQARNKTQELKLKGIRVVLATGAWDWLHLGHLFFLESAQKIGGILMVGVENDTTIELNKGPGRPICTLDDRLIQLATLVDFTFGFTDIPRYINSNNNVHTNNFDLFVQRYKYLQPDVLSVSSFDPNLELKRAQTAAAGVELVIVNNHQWGSTTSQLEAYGRPTRIYPWEFLISRVVRECVNQQREGI